jgi:hypothetical protein
VLPACRLGAHGAFSLQAGRTRCFQPAGWAHTVRSRPPSPEVMPHGTCCEVVTNSLALRCAPRSWTLAGLPRFALVDAGCACALERRRNPVRPRRRSAAKPERLIDGFAGRAVWHYPPAQQGVVAAANAQCAFSLQAGRTLCFQPAGVAHTVLLACRRGAHGASSLQAWRTRCFQPAGWAHTVRSRPPSPEVMPHGTCCEVLTNSLALRCAPRSWTLAGLPRFALVDAGCACALERRRNPVRPRRRSAAKPERLIDGFAGRAVWHYPPAQQGVVAAANAQCAFSLQAGRTRCFQPAGWAHTVRSRPPSPEVMPHGTCCEVLTNSLALRFAPRSWTLAGLPRFALVDAGCACALERRRNPVRPRRRSAAKPERLIDGFAGRAVWHYPPAQQGVVAAANALCAFSLQAWRTRCFQPAGVAHTVLPACRLGAHGASSLQAGRTRCVRGRHQQR